MVCEQVLEHLHNPEITLSEISRVIRPGGLLIVGVPSFPPGMAWLRVNVVPTFDRLSGRQRGHHQVFTAGSFRRMKGMERFDLVKLREFRSFSGGPFAPLADQRWWYRLNRRLGRLLPGLCTELQLVARVRALVGYTMPDCGTALSV